MVKLYKGEYSVEDLARISRNPNARTAGTPWAGKGNVGIVRYVGAPAPWKGKKVPGAAKMRIEDIRAIIGDHGRLPETIQKLALTATAPETKAKGVSAGLINYLPAVLPTRCFKIAEAWGKPVKIFRSADSLVKLLKEYRVPYPKTVAEIPLPVL